MPRSSGDSDSRFDDSRPAIRRLTLAWPYRVGLFFLFLALLLAIWRPAAPSPEELGAAANYLAAEYPGYEFAEPRAERWPFGQLKLTYQTDHRGTPARVVVSLSTQGGRVVVVSDQLYIGGTDAVRLTKWGISLVTIFALIYLVFFVSIPRTFGRKCPRHLSLLRLDERVVVAGKFDISGVGFAPIIERVYSCRTCDFQHCEALVDPTYWPTATLPHMSSTATNEMRKKYAITNEEYERLLAAAKEDARARSSSDSPWLQKD